MPDASQFHDGGFASGESLNGIDGSQFHGVRAPAEWEPHERTLMGWPCRTELWGETIEQARVDYAAVANAIAAFEPVTMVANPGPDFISARAACGQGVEVVELPLDDSWLRDCGPIYVYGDDGRRIAVHFRFNAWGERFRPWDRDAAVGRLIAERLGDEVRSAPLVLEGGSILTDGEGTLLTTEQCLLQPQPKSLAHARGDRDGAARLPRRGANPVAGPGAAGGP